MSNDISYTHKVKINQKFTLYPSVTASYAFPIRLSDMLLEDAIISGSQSLDPLYQLNEGKGYLDFNAGFLIKNDKFLLD